MAHLNPIGVDLVVSAFVVFRRSALLVDPKKLGGWFPPGGHVELTELDVSDLLGVAGETADEAVYRELVQETGLTQTDLEPVGQSYFRPHHLLSAEDLKVCHDTKHQLRPWFVDVHDFPPVTGHRHLALVYLFRSTKKVVTLEESAHKEIRWFSKKELQETQMMKTIKVYSSVAIDEAGWGSEEES